MVSSERPVLLASVPTNVALNVSKCHCTKYGRLTTSSTLIVVMHNAVGTMHAVSVHVIEHKLPGTIL